MSGKSQPKTPLYDSSMIIVHKYDRKIFADKHLHLAKNCASISFLPLKPLKVSPSGILDFRWPTSTLLEYFLLTMTDVPVSHTVGSKNLDINLKHNVFLKSVAIKIAVFA